MESRTLGQTGLQVSALGYGAGAVGGLMVRGDADEQRRAIARALDAGITYFDTAPGYGDGRSEENLGRALRHLAAWDRAIVGTKVRLAPADLADQLSAIRRSVEASLRRLGHDTVDLIQLHNSIRQSAAASATFGGSLRWPRSLARSPRACRRCNALDWPRMLALRGWASQQRWRMPCAPVTSPPCRATSMSTIPAIRN